MYKSLKTENKQTKYKINKKVEERIPYFHNFSTKFNLTVVSLSFIIWIILRRILLKMTIPMITNLFHMLLQMSIEKNSKVVLPNMNLFTDNVKWSSRPLCSSYNFLHACRLIKQQKNKDWKCLPPSANANKITFEQSTNRTAKKKGRLERNDLSLSQVNFMSQFKNNRCKTLFSCYGQKKWND